MASGHRRHDYKTMSNWSAFCNSVSRLSLMYSKSLEHPWRDYPRDRIDGFQCATSRSSTASLWHQHRVDKSARTRRLKRAIGMIQIEGFEFDLRFDEVVIKQGGDKALADAARSWERELVAWRSCDFIIFRGQSGPAYSRPDLEERRSSVEPVDSLNSREVSSARSPLDFPPLSVDLCAEPLDSADGCGRTF